MIINVSSIKQNGFLSLEEAQNAVRSIISAGVTEPVTVSIESGEYLTKGITLDIRDSGTKDCPVTWKGNGNVTLNGGMTIPSSFFFAINDEERARLHGTAKEKVVKCDLKTLGLTKSDWGELSSIGTYSSAQCYDGAVTKPVFCELFVNGKRQVIARYPNEGYLFTKDPVRTGLEDIEARGLPTGDLDWDNGVVRNPMADIYTLDEETAKRASGWRDISGAWMFGYPMFNWADMSSPIKSIDPESGHMETRWVSRFGMKPNAPIYFYNIFEELDAPGEWFLDRDNGILYLYPDCSLEDADIKISITSQNILKIENGEHLHIENVGFTGTRGDAIDATGHDISFDGCDIRNVAGWAMILDGTNISVKNCNIERTGKGGISVDGGDRNSLISSNNVIDNNHIHHIAELFKTYNPAVRLKGVGVLCSHNKIHDSAHCAILFFGNNHIMEYNEIYEVCKNAEDSSAIYAGRDYTIAGNIIRYNYFHDMTSEAENTIGIFGFYCDDNLGPVTCEHNIFVRCQSALLFHGGHDAVFRQNIIAKACPKSVYSMRFHRFFYWRDLLPGATHDRYMKEVSWNNETWKKAYPHLAEYLTWDPEEEQPIPHYADISENVIIEHKPIDINFKWDEERLHNRIEGNITIDKMPTEDLSKLCEEVIPSMVEGFEPIPFGEIGIRKSGRHF